MKITVNAGEFFAALRGPYDRSKPQGFIPVLKHIRVEASGERIGLLGHDLDSSSEASVDAEVEVEGVSVIPAEPLVRLVGGLPKAASVIIEIVGLDAIVRSGRSRYKLPTMLSGDMPLALSADGGFSFSVATADLEQLLLRPRPTIDVKEPRTCFQGLYLHADGGKLCSVATNGSFLMRFSTEIDAAGFPGAIVPRTAADEILKIGAGEITISDRIISISSGSRTYSSKLIDSTFPEHYRRTIPATDSGFVKFDRDTVLEGLARLRAVGDFGGSDLIDIAAGAGEMTISVTGAADGSEKIECDADSELFTCLRSTQFLESLKAMKGETLALYCRSAREAVRIFDPAEPSAVNVLMPCASKTARNV